MQIVRLIESINAVLLRFNLEPYYNPPKIHMSFCSIEEDITESEVRLEDFNPLRPFNRSIKIQEIGIRTADVHHQVKLR